jgi:diguanylate cyclase (GGDEF)-like protein
MGARILSVVDCFDALTSDRPYRPRLSDKDAVNILVERRGEMYDPLVVDTFLRLHADGGFRTSSITEQSAFSAIAASATLAESVSPNRNSLEDIAASGEEMLALFELARGLNKPMSVADVGEVVVRHLRRIVPAALSVLYLYDVATDELVSAYASGDHADLVGGLRIPLGQRLTGWVGANRQSIRNSDPILDLGEGARSVTPRPRSCLSAPLTISDSLIGVLTLYSSSRSGFSEDHQRVIEVIARQIAPVVQQALTFDRTRPFGSSESLTASSSSDLRFTTLDRNRSVAWQSPLALVCVDLGGWQDFRSQIDQNAGDAILARLIACVQRQLRAADILLRYDSEILVVQFQTDKALALAIADQIRQSMQSEVVVVGIQERVRISVGVSAMPEDGQSAEGLRTIARRRARRQVGLAVGDLNQPPESVH